MMRAHHQAVQHLLEARGAVLTGACPAGFTVVVALQSLADTVERVRAPWPIDLLRACVPAGSRSACH